MWQWLVVLPVSVVTQYLFFQCGRRVERRIGMAYLQQAMEAQKALLMAEFREAVMNSDRRRRCAMSADPGGVARPN